MLGKNRRQEARLSSLAFGMTGNEEFIKLDACQAGQPVEEVEERLNSRV